MKDYTECKNALIVGLQNKSPLLTEYLLNNGIDKLRIESTTIYLTLCGQCNISSETSTVAEHAPIKISEFDFVKLTNKINSAGQVLSAENPIFTKFALHSIIMLINGLHKGAPNIVEYLKIDSAIINDEIESDIELYVSILKNLSIQPCDPPVESTT